MKHEAGEAHKVDEAYAAYKVCKDSMYRKMEMNDNESRVSEIVVSLVACRSNIYPTLRIG